MRVPKIDLPRSVRSMARLGMSLGVGVAIAMAPLIGAKRIPFFQPLVDLFPESHRNVLIPVSAFLLGLIAASVHLLVGERISQARIRRRFAVTLVVIVTGVAALVGLRQFYFVEVPCAPEPVVVGWYRLDGCGCGAAVSDKECIQGNACGIEGCWKESHARQVTLALQLTYLVTLCGFEILVGLLTLRETSRAETKRRNRGKSKPRRRSAAPEPEGTPSATVP